jgi:hypothetical protein
VIIQFGRCYAGSTITYPLSFNEVSQVLVSIINGVDADASSFAGSVTLTSFLPKTKIPQTTKYFNHLLSWIAIGY